MDASSPAPGDVEAAGDADALILLHIIEETDEAGGTGAVADQAHMQADRLHLGLAGALRIENVEDLLASLQIVVRRAKEARAELAVIIDQRIGHDQMMPASTVKGSVSEATAAKGPL